MNKDQDENPDQNRRRRRCIHCTPIRVGKLFIFYTAFYSVLAVLVAICWVVFNATNSDVYPKWQLNKSRIGTNPGLCLRPMPTGSNILTFITLSADYQYWTDELEKFLAVYIDPSLTPGRKENIYDCDYDKLPKLDQVCKVDVEKWEPCTKKNHFKFDTYTPCIFIKLNKIYNWMPEFYNSSTDLPDNMPDNLKTHITGLEKADKKKLNTIWVSCEGFNATDNENIGKISYYPQPGFPGYFYPYMNTKGYLSPLVAVHFEKPITNTKITIVCIPWAKNIFPDKELRKGRLEFTLELLP